MKTWIATLALLCLPVVATAQIQVVVPIAPIAHVVEAIGGSQVAVNVLVPKGANMHTYEPKASQLAHIARAQIYFSVGDVFDAVWIPRLRTANPKLQIVELFQGIERLPMAVHSHEDSGEHHDHAVHGQNSAAHPHREHHEGMPDPHIWLSPRLLGHMSVIIRDTLTQVDPDHAAEFTQRQQAWQEQVQALDQEIQALFQSLPQEKKAFIVFHPAWGYFAKDYDLRQIPIEVQGKEPSPKQLAATLHKAGAAGATVVFVQPQVSTKTADAVARHLGGRIAVIDPLGSDVLQNIRHAAQAIADAIR